MKRAILSAVVCLGLLVAAWEQVQAGVIVSNLGGTVGSNWGVIDTSWSATRFTTSATNYTVESIVLHMSNGSPPSSRSDDGIFAAIYSNVTGKPGSLVGSTLTTMTDIPNTPTLVTFIPSGTPASLSSSTDYWVVVGVEPNSLPFQTEPNPILSRTTDTGSGPGTMHLDILYFRKFSSRLSGEI